MHSSRGIANLGLDCPEHHEGSLALIAPEFYGLDKTMAFRCTIPCTRDDLIQRPYCRLEIVNSQDFDIKFYQALEVAGCLEESRVVDQKSSQQDGRSKGGEADCRSRSLVSRSGNRSKAP